MPQDKPQTELKHPPDYQRDLNPDHMAGQNIGETTGHDSEDTRYASEIKDLITLLPDFTMDELRQIPVLREGTRLQQGGTYVDLKDPDHKPITATGEMTAGPDNWYVAKADVPYPYWNRLIGVPQPERTQ